MTAQFNFLTEDHRMIADSARTAFADLAAADDESRQQNHARLERGVVAEALTDLGVFSSDALDSTMRAALVQVQIAREAGGACLSYPLLETLIAAAASGNDGAANVVTSIPTAPQSLANLPVYEQGRVTGIARRVPFAHWAEATLLWAHSRGSVVLVRAPLHGAGVRLEERVSVEPDYPLYDVHMEAVAATVVQPADGDGRRVQQRADLLATAEMAGVSRRMVSMTRDYLLARSQFNRVLGSNQALKHALADAHVRVEAIVMSTDYAAASFDARAADSAVSIAAAKRFAGRASKLVAESMLQLHGAIGYTMEYPLHLFMRRVHRLANSYSTRDDLSKRLVEHFTALD